MSSKIYGRIGRGLWLCLRVRLSPLATAGAATGSIESAVELHGGNRIVHRPCVVTYSDYENGAKTSIRTIAGRPAAAAVMTAPS